MADPEPIDTILRKIKKKWDDDKENWNVLSNFDKDGNNEMLISQTPNTYWLKMKQINAYQNMTFGKELTNIDNEINKKSSDGTPFTNLDPQKEMLRLFGMMVPSKKDILYTSGIELHSPETVQKQKAKIEEKQADADKQFRKYIRDKWKREFFEREGLYM